MQQLLLAVSVSQGMSGIAFLKGAATAGRDVAASTRSSETPLRLEHWDKTIVCEGTLALSPSTSSLGCR